MFARINLKTEADSLNIVAHGKKAHPVPQRERSCGSHACFLERKNPFTVSIGEAKKFSFYFLVGSESYNLFCGEKAKRNRVLAAPVSIAVVEIGFSPSPKGELLKSFP